MSATDIDLRTGFLPLKDFADDVEGTFAEAARGRPVVIAEDGRPVAVVLSPEAFEAMRDEVRIRDAVARGMADIREGRTISHERVMEWMDSWGTEHELPPPCPE